MRSWLKKMVRTLNRRFWSTVIARQCGSFESTPSVNFSSRVTATTHLGTNVNFNGMFILGGGKVTIGNNFHSGVACRMLTQFHDFDNGDAIPYGSSNILKDIIIEENVWFGDRVMILGGVVIGEGAIIQAGSVVVSDIPPYAIAGGHPAKVFKTRNIEHYELLKKEKRFH